MELYINYYQKEGNHLVDKVNDTLGLKNEKFRSVYYQGMIDLLETTALRKMFRMRNRKKFLTNYFESVFNIIT